MSKTVELYQDTAGEHRWRLRSGNAAVTTGPEEGYRRPGARTKAMARDLGGVFTPDHDRGLPGDPEPRHSGRRRVGVLRRKEPTTDPHYAPGTFIDVEIPVVEVKG